MLPNGKGAGYFITLSIVAGSTTTATLSQRAIFWSGTAGEDKTNLLAPAIGKTLAWRERARVRAKALLAVKQRG